MESLDGTLKYRNPAVVRRFQSVVSLSDREADEIFIETIRFLWIMAQATSQGKSDLVFVDFSLAIIDEMWHVFLLFTEEYDNFCKSKFGFYIHHHPAVDDVPVEESEMELQLTEMYSFIYDMGGEATVTRWFAEFPQRYPPELIASRKIAALATKAV